MKAIRLSMVFILLLLSLSQSSCFVPEDFNVNIDIRKDGGYTFKYDGKLAYVMALAAIQEGKLSKKDKEELKKMEKEMEKSSDDVKKFDYIGNGRYQTLVNKKGIKGEDYHFLSSEINIISIEYDDETMQVKAFKINEKDIEQLRQLKAKVEGVLSVSVDKGLKVSEHNADKVSGGLYQWRINKPDTAPKLIVRL